MRSKAARHRQEGGMHLRLDRGLLCTVSSLHCLATLAPSPARAQVLQWQEIRRAEATQLSAVAFDPIRGITLRYGGMKALSTPQGELWDWDGRSWKLRSSGGPGTRHSAAMCFDTDRGVGVMFGGWGTFGASSQTWEWTGQEWTQRAVNGPSPRYATGLAYDSRRHVAVLFGGFSGSSELGETWEWDGTSWTQRQVSGPSNRSYHAMAYDSVRGVTVLFGGSTDVSQKNNETWEWNGATWSLRATTGPSPRFAAAMCFDTARERIQLSGGRLEIGASNELWEWDGTTWTLRPAANARPLASHSMVFDPDRRSLVAVGSDPTEIGPLLFDGTSWTTAENTSAPVGSMLSLVENPTAGTLIAIGPPQTPSGLETWTWNGAFWRRHGGIAPSQRTDFAVAVDTSRGVLVLHGGSDPSGTLLAETWEWNGSAWNRLDIPGPSPRRLHAMAFDERRGVTVLFGGTNGERDLDDLWEYDGHAWTRRQTQIGPSRRARHAMAYDASRGIVVLTGGVEQSIFNDRGVAVLLGPDWWEWNGVQWTNRVSEAAPQARVDHQLVQDKPGGRLLMFGGRTEDGATQELWQLLGTAWSRLQISGPALSASSLGRIAFDSPRRRLTMTSRGLSGSFALRALAFTPCVADLSVDGIVNDGDFELFVAGYGLVRCSEALMPATCPADLNADRLVDDADFLLFVQAYDSVACPQ